MATKTLPSTLRLKWRKAGKNVSTKYSLNEYLPDNTILWLVFDMNNGHKGSRRYVWWFDTKKDALDHIKEQKKMYGAELSEPHKVRLIG